MRQPERRQHAELAYLLPSGCRTGIGHPPFVFGARGSVGCVDRQTWSRSVMTMGPSTWLQGQIWIASNRPARWNHESTAGIALISGMRYLDDHSSRLRRAFRSPVQLPEDPEVLLSDGWLI